MIVDYLPPVIKKIEEMRAICAAEQPLFDEAEKEIETILCRVFIGKADEKGIERFEREYGIIPGEHQTLEERRVAILIRASKKNLSLMDVTNLLYNYSDEIVLNPNYNTDELTVNVGDNTTNLATIYGTLDDLIGLQVLIKFAMEITSAMEFAENKKGLTLETTIKSLGDSESLTWKQAVEIMLQSTIKITETFDDTELEIEKDLWYLDGTVKLDGSRILDAEVYREEIE